MRIHSFMIKNHACFKEETNFDFSTSVSVLHGGPGTGKTEALKALKLLLDVATGRFQPSQVLPYNPFRFNEAVEPTLLSLSFSKGGKIFKYEYEFGYKGIFLSPIRESLHYATEEDGIASDAYIEVFSVRYPDIFMKLGGEVFHSYLYAHLRDFRYHDLVKYFLESINIYLTYEDLLTETKRILANPTQILGNGVYIREFVKSMGFSIVDMDLERINEDEIIWLTHSNRTVRMPFSLHQESHITQKLIALSGPLVTSLVTGVPFIVDGIQDLPICYFDGLLSLFDSNQINPWTAQMISTYEAPLSRFWDSSVKSLIKHKDQASRPTDLTLFTDEEFDNPFQIRPFSTYKTTFGEII